MTLEELQQQLLETQEKLQQLAEDNKTLNDIVQAKTEREKELEEHNQKLFLRVANPVLPNITKDDEDIKEVAEHIGTDLYNILNKKELELLNTIVKGEDE